jgi:hypothetical protein
MAWLGRLKHEDLVRFALHHRVDYDWMLTGNLRGLLRTVRRLARWSGRLGSLLL